MNNFGIILNQDNNQSYLGKFYNRNTLEFPVIRKIYEKIENNKSKELSNNINENVAMEDRNILYLENNNNEYTNNINNKITIDKIDINLENNNLDSEDIIILDKINGESKINNELIDNNTNNIEQKKNELYTENIPSSYLEIGKKIEKEIEKENQSSYFNFNSKEVIFLWISSILIIYNIEYNILKFF
jgi:hypothetical protein